MEAVVAVPSYHRPYSKIFAKLDKLDYHKYIFVRKEDFLQYSYLSKEFDKFTVVPMSNVTNIGDTRRWLLNYFSKLGDEWVFMFDDDIRKVESLAWNPKSGRYDAIRIIEGSVVPPRFEQYALEHWLDTAIKYDLSMSSPCIRYGIGAKGKHLKINSGDCIQAVLLHVPDIIKVGNYKSTNEVGAEDMAIQFELMRNNLKTGIVCDIEYDCPNVGAGSGGNNDVEDSDMTRRYSKYVKTFLEKVCNDPRMITVKTTKTGLPSLKHVWKHWEGGKIPL